MNQDLKKLRAGSGRGTRTKAQEGINSLAACMLECIAAGLEKEIHAS